MYIQLTELQIEHRMTTDVHDAWCMMPPQHGTLILMDVTQNSLQHMVTQVTHAHDRYALAGWLA